MSAAGQSLDEIIAAANLCEASERFLRYVCEGRQTFEIKIIYDALIAREMQT